MKRLVRKDAVSEMGMDEMESENYQIKRDRQRKAFNSVWKRIIAMHQLDDCLVDEFLNAIQEA